MNQQQLQTESHRETLQKVALVMFGLICALSFRSWLYFDLEADGMGSLTARHLTFFVQLPLLALLLFPLWKGNKQILIGGLKPAQLTLRIILIGIGLGIAHRVAMDGILIARVAFGFLRNADPNAIVGPVFALSCPPATLVALHLVSLSFLVPITEEILHRGWLVSWLSRYGRWSAVVVSSVLFMILHQPGSMDSAFIFGLFLAVVYLNTGSLWPGIIAHCVSNALILLDWHCLGTVWNPVGSSPVLYAVGTIAALMTLFALAFAALLVSRRIAAPKRDDGRASS